MLTLRWSRHVQKLGRLLRRDFGLRGHKRYRVARPEFFEDIRSEFRVYAALNREQERKSRLD